MGSEKTFDATPGRLAKAKREGDLPRSQAATAVVSFAAAAAGFAASAGAWANAACTALTRATRGEIDGGAYATICGWMLVPLACAGLAATAFTIVHGGGLRIVPPTLKFKRLHPADGFKRMLSKESVVAALKAVAVAGVLTVAMVPTVHDVFGRSLGGDAFAVATVVRDGVLRLAGAGIAVGAVFGVLDAIMERKRWRDKLKMSFDEVKRDYKQAEGDPLLRNRRKARHKALIRGSTTKLRRAAFVVTNPTHVAIALEYRPPEIPVPRVVVRAVDEGAQAVKARARELRIPIVENVPLARALLAGTDVEHFIPRDAYVAVAQIVAALSREGRLAP